jgi:hypothetical protein
MWSNNPMFQRVQQQAQQQAQQQRQQQEQRRLAPEAQKQACAMKCARLPENQIADCKQRCVYQGFADYADPQWMQSISNSTICNWFYTFYLANLVVFFLVIGLGAYMFFRNKRQFTATNLFLALLQLIVAGTNMLFFYLICDRTLKP